MGVGAGGLADLLERGFDEEDGAGSLEEEADEFMYAGRSLLLFGVNIASSSTSIRSNSAMRSNSVVEGCLEEVRGEFET